MNKCIGIVGGAGPEAGIALAKRIVSFAQTRYGCKKDQEFPKLLLLSVPFSEMLQAPDRQTLTRELAENLSQLRAMGASFLGIACNTLHVFLSEEDQSSSDLVPLPSLVADEINRRKLSPLVLCTTTTRQANLYGKCFPCRYPDGKAQKLVDALIDSILCSGATERAADQLQELINTLNEKTILLGCTELSLLKRDLRPNGVEILDPLDLLAINLLDQAMRCASKGGQNGS